IGACKDLDRNSVNLMIGVRMKRVLVSGLTRTLIVVATTFLLLATMKLQSFCQGMVISLRGLTISFSIATMQMVGSNASQTFILPILHSIMSYFFLLGSS